jgi:hypothetical protein
MTHRGYIRPRLIDPRVDEALDVGDRVRVPGHFPLAVELEDVLDLHVLGGPRTGQQEVAGFLGMAHAHVTVCVEDSLVTQNPVRRDELSPDIDWHSVTLSTRPRAAATSW